jgi:hypothetical protein
MNLVVQRIDPAHDDGSATSTWILRNAQPELRLLASCCLSVHMNSSEIFWTDFHENFNWVLLNPVERIPFLVKIRP